MGGIWAASGLVIELALESQSRRGFHERHRTYEISNGVTYGGDTLQAVDRNIIFGYHGEFFRNQGQAGQHMHFYDDGLFVANLAKPLPGTQPTKVRCPGSMETDIVPA